MMRGLVSVVAKERVWKEAHEIARVSEDKRRRLCRGGVGWGGESLERLYLHDGTQGLEFHKWGIVIETVDGAAIRIRAVSLHSFPPTIHLART